MSNEQQYYKVQVMNAETCIRFHSLAEFDRFVRNNSIRSIFIMDSKETPGTDAFGCAHKGGVYMTATEGFAALEDFREALAGNFTAASDFYDAKKLGYTRYNDYLLATVTNVTDKKEYDAMVKGNFPEVFRDYLEILSEENNSLTPLSDVNNPMDFYRHAHKNGFADARKCLNAWKAGFPDATAQGIALDRGFKNYADYNTATSLGFVMGSDLEFARKEQIRDHADMQRYLHLELMKKRAPGFDQRVMLVLLSRLPQNKEYKTETLWKLLEKEIKTYHYADTGALPAWFVRELQLPIDLETFLTQHDAVKEFGQYNYQSHTFVVKKLSERKVVLDGSNVAHNSQGDKESKPTVANMLLVVKELKKKGFSTIKIISDASLKHKLTDMEAIEELKAMCDYGEAPAEKPADTFIINYVKIHNCLLVSNDHYREWKFRDPWIEDNVDFYRISFKIKGKEVVFPDLETEN